MFSPAMLYFLSRENINQHIEYMKELMCKLAIIQKSSPELLGKSPETLLKMRLGGELGREARSLASEYLSHKLYFRSFAENGSPCREIRRYYSSEDAFLYEILELARRCGEGFIYIYKCCGAPPRVIFSEKPYFTANRELPTLALDICEHAYFSDYRFQRDMYLRSSLARLDIAKLFEEAKKDLT